MSSNTRILRSAAPFLKTERIPPNIVLSPVSFTASTTSSSRSTIQIVPPGSKLPGLSNEDLILLRQKQFRLAKNAFFTSSLITAPHIRNALEATLIFAQYEAGTAVCIDPAGWMLTASHCFGDTREEWKANKRKWLLCYNGLAVQVECRTWDPKGDMALCKIIAVESSGGSDGEVPQFRFLPLSSYAPAVKEPTVCIGQPGRDDLECTFARRTKYNLVEVSEGTFRGLIDGADPHDNSEIGTLMHDAWTYWGHSGAPLLKEADGTLVGLHSSWDDQTTMRHGIPLVAIERFLEQQRLPTDGPSTFVGRAAAQLDRLGRSSPIIENS